MMSILSSHHDVISSHHINIITLLLLEKTDSEIISRKVNFQSKELKYE